MTIDELKERVTVGDKVRIRSNNKKLWYRGLYDGIVLTVSDKRVLHMWQEFKPVTVICVRYTPIKFRMRYSGESLVAVPAFGHFGEPSCMKLPDTDPETFWYEIVEGDRDENVESAFDLCNVPLHIAIDPDDIDESES